MNYLGHALLSFDDAQILTGNLIGDHVKGKLALNNYPERIRKGIELHRKIDVFTDNHPASKRARLWLRESYGLYSGAIVDSLYDHFLANDPRYFSSEKDLLLFTQKVYENLEEQSRFFPPVFAQYFPYMKEQNWLYNYRNLQGVQRSLGGLYKKAKHMPPVEEAYKIFIGHYYQLAQCYYELIDDIVPFVKLELSH
ncbi:MAG TPA: ACP phosphodiesterase [Flavipsychrobacter sp.]|nr:ACP phosphodiesterase [Flavipsychrobacter sp.]